MNVSAFAITDAEEPFSQVLLQRGVSTPISSREDAQKITINAASLSKMCMKG